MEYNLSSVCATPGQLWRNVRTGEALFIYKKGPQIEGVLCSGRKKTIKDLIKLEQGTSGWVCIYSPHHAEHFDKIASGSYEFK